jgi:DNA recombination protein RmuC
MTASTSNAAYLAIAVTAVIAAAALLWGMLLGRRLGRRDMSGRAPELESLESALDRLARRVDEAEALRRVDHAGMRAELAEQLRHVEATTEIVRRETGQLAKALGRVDMRGRWGEAHLRRLVESAGMLDRVHFTEQDVRAHDDGIQRPDLVIDIGGGRSLVVDAKVPLGALLEAEASDNDHVRAELYARHARDVAQHAERLGSKDYWRRYDDSLEAVVLFLPAESLLGMALREDPSLLERSFARGVIIATPTTFLALLRTVSHVWRREVIADNAREIHALGRELHERLGVALDHMRRMGSSLDNAVSHYNRLVGSVEGRVLVSGRRLADLGVSDTPLPDIPAITQRTRAPATPSAAAQTHAVTLP